MTSDEETRLWPSEPTQSGRPPLPPPPTGPPHGTSRRRWLLAIVVILILAFGALTTLLVRANRNRAADPAPTGSQSVGVSSAPATSGPASTSPTGGGSSSPAPPALLPRGKEAPASAIPWSQVNAGWNLRAWSGRANPNALPPAPSTLYLVNPIGGWYRITILAPNTALAAWSPDRRRAIVVAYGPAGSRLVQEIELSSGRRLSSFVLGSRGLHGYAGPGGSSLLLGKPGRGPSGWERVSTSGADQQSFPNSASQTGRLTENPLYSPDGSMFIVGGERGLAVFSNDGPLLRQVRYPTTGYLCDAVRWWSARVALGQCGTRLPNGNHSARNLALISVDEGTITPITNAVAPDDGFATAWQFSNGIIAQRAASCGPGPLATIDRSGAAHPYNYRLPAGTAGQAVLVGVYADQATLVTGNCGNDSRSLVSLNLRTGATSVLLGAGLNGGSILGS